MASPTPVLNVSHASILIGHNNYNAVLSAMELAGLADSRCEFLLNTVENSSYDSSYCVLAYDNVIAGTVVHITSSEILISNNAFIKEQNGVNIGGRNTPGATFEGGTRCQVVSNTFQTTPISDKGIGIDLGTGTSHCIVAGNSPTTIQNLGTDNVIVNKGSAP